MPDEVLMIEPLPESSIAETPCLQPIITLHALIAIVRSQPSTSRERMHRSPSIEALIAIADPADRDELEEEVSDVRCVFHEASRKRSKFA